MIRDRHYGLAGKAAAGAAMAMMPSFYGTRAQCPRTAPGEQLAASHPSYFAAFDGGPPRGGFSASIFALLSSGFTKIGPPICEESRLSTSAPVHGRSGAGVGVAGVLARTRRRNTMAITIRAMSDPHNGAVLQRPGRSSMLFASPMVDADLLPHNRMIRLPPVHLNAEQFPDH